MGVRAEMLELAVLGELDQPTHGYELRRRLSESVGTLRRLSFGSLYPALHRLERGGLITAQTSPDRPGKLLYTITEAGRSHLAEELEHVDSDDDSFGVAMGLMSKASPAARLRLLQDRRARVLERREARRRAGDRGGASPERDPWRFAQRQMEAEAADREITWLDRLIAASQTPQAGPPSSTPPTKRRATRANTPRPGSRRASAAPTQKKDTK
ncbi:PadR family transcriptional regulator [Schaalia naturae]|uniref:PadR family transcriptional regulator n=1 Tax=Schaalia naturae TaxID=635203 RepID=A0ABW2SNK2_9ACTO